MEILDGGARAQGRRNGDAEACQRARAGAGCGAGPRAPQEWLRFCLEEEFGAILIFLDASKERGVWQSLGLDRRDTLL